ncbi:hypothetical protein CD178_03285 (plasmid) [Komagataeibacter saccharivorans]|uniref:Uncharacterized protein n=1 Tax=Komagataeibacter saccharivorans TaxID=265959 RepID=A0A347WGN6_9PROT|nr:hypothetical protein CD178_03285 [Komagataeibacter saccharivorans]
MIVGASSRRPMEQSVSGLYRQVIDRCDPAAHKPGGIEFPQFIAVRPEPSTRIIMPFIGKTDSHAVIAETPEFLDQAVFVLYVPFACQEGHDLIASGHRTILGRIDYKDPCHLRCPE